MLATMVTVALTSREATAVGQILTSEFVSRGGAEILQRCKGVDLFLLRYFDNSLGIIPPADIEHTPEYATLGQQMLQALAEACKHTDEPARLTQELDIFRKVLKDADNFKIYTEALMSSISEKMPNFTPQNKQNMEKFLKIAGDCLGKNSQ
ncbi:uncharacterized protein LOC144785385 [Lissotriton helveticus]